MRKIIIEITDEQHKAFINEAQRGLKINHEEETHSDFKISLSVVSELGLAFLEVGMLNKKSLGEVEWRIE